MSFLYNCAIRLYGCGAACAGLWSSKARQWHAGRRGIIESIAERLAPGERRIWIHAASLGEFEQGRPIIEKLKRQAPDVKVVLTFFSPSGYEIRKAYPGADYIFYLPEDTTRNVTRFLDLVEPEAAIFIKYEFWLEYLHELRKRRVPTYLTSAIFRRNSIFFRPWGGAWRRALTSFSTMFVQDSNSEALLKELGFERVVTAGDTRFDRVAEIARQAKELPFVERFRGDKELFIAGSTWGADEELLVELANHNPDIKFIIAPHEMEESRIAKLMATTKGGAVRYSQMTDEGLQQAQLLIIDAIGMLSSLYRYGRWGYIGGGFGRGIHNTLEAAVHGLPLAFGPNYRKFKEACDLISLGAAYSVERYEHLETWFKGLREDDSTYNAAATHAREYTLQNCGATDRIVRHILEKL